ncbi:MAG: hypothetical protein WC718_10005 [Phycisphaerales bacterium]|jgi:uncharacterized repeat protein (TIGR01451 family)
MSIRTTISVACAAGLCWAAATANAQLVCGNDQSGPVIYMVDVTGVTPPRTLVTGNAALVSGIAADEVGRVLYWTNGSQIYKAAYQTQGTLTPVLVGAVAPSITGLAFDTAARKLYGRAPDGLYDISVTTGAATRVFLSTAQDFGGFDYDPAADAFYGLNDSTQTTLLPGRGVYRIDKPLSSPTFTRLADYPAGEFDLDGLAAGGGRLYMVNDTGAQPIYVYDLATSRYLTPLTSPFTGSMGPINAAGAWAPGMFVAGPSADLELTCTDSPDPVVPPGGLLTYTLQVRNLGPTAATGVVVTGTLPAGVTPNLLSTPGVVTAGVYTAALGTLASGAVVPLTIRVATSVADSLVFTPMVTSALFDPSQLNNSALVTTTVRPTQADLSVSALGPQPCTRGTGEAVSYTITLANQGPDTDPGATLQLTLPAGVQVLSSTPPISGSGRDYTFGPVSMASNQTRTISLSVIPSSAGENVLALSVGGSLEDPAPTNNAFSLATLVAGVPPATSPIRGIFSTVANSNSSLVPGISGVRFSSVGGIGRPFKSESGARWIVQSDTDAPASSDSMLLAGGGTQFAMVAREGTTPLLPTLPANTYRPFGTFDPVQGINDSGQYVFSGLDARTDTSTDGYVAAWDGFGYRLIMQEGGPAPAVGAGASYGSSRGSATIRADGSTSFFASLAGTGVTASTDQGLFISDGNVLVERKGLSVPVGQAFGGTFTYKSFDTGSVPGLGFFPDAFASNWCVSANINASTSQPAPGGMDRVAVVSNSVAVQENAPLSGTGIFSNARDTTPFTALLMDPEGTSYCIGGSNDGTDWVLRNGFPLTTSGSQIAPGESELWTRPAGATNAYFLAAGNRIGDVVLGGYTNGPGLNNLALVLNGFRVLMRGNDPVDVNNNGVFDDQVYVRDVKPYHGFVSDDGYLYVVVTLRSNDAANCGGQDTSVGEALVRIALNPVEVTPCDPDLNQDGNADQGDIDYLINVVAGGQNPTFIDPDFNHDGNVDQGDVDELVNVVAGGPCP